MGGAVLRRTSRRAGLGAVALAAAAGLSACGAGTHFADNPRPPEPTNLSVYVDNHHVSVSPNRLGGGPVTLIVTNASGSTQDVTLTSADGGSGRSSGSINSGATANIQTSVSRGTYEISAGPNVQPAKLTIGAQRPNADNALLQP